jgi:hypothetical protein
MSNVIKLSGTKKGIISVVKMDKPYGEDSESVASVAISLNGDIEEVDWKVHIPISNLNEVIKALESLKA